MTGQGLRGIPLPLFRKNVGFDPQNPRKNVGFRVQNAWKNVKMFVHLPVYK